MPFGLFPKGWKNLYSSIYSIPTKNHFCWGWKFDSLKQLICLKEGDFFSRNLFFLSSAGFSLFQKLRPLVFPIIHLTIDFQFVGYFFFLDGCFIQRRVFIRHVFWKVIINVSVLWFIPQQPPAKPDEAAFLVMGTGCLSWNINSPFLSEEISATLRTLCTKCSLASFVLQLVFFLKKRFLLILNCHTAKEKGLV